MIQDISAILWKEYRAVVQHRIWHGIAEWQIVLTSFCGLGLVMGLRDPSLAGSEAVYTPALFGIGAVLVQVADTFAGERERRTLEALLSTPLSDGAIFTGKVLFVTMYGWIAAMVLQVTVTVAVASRFGMVAVEPAAITAGTVLAFPAVSVAALAGALISLRSRTVKAAQITLVSLLMTFMVGLGLLTVASVHLLRMLPGGPPAWVVESVRWIANEATLLGYFTVAAVVLLIANLALFGYGVARFRRDRILS